KLPDKTIERLSMYRRNLILCLRQGKQFIYSHEIANSLHITPVQVRRDIMLIGYTGTLRKGYDVKELIDLIGSIIDTDGGKNVAVVGIGNLGKAIVSYFNGKRSKLRIIAAFDADPDKTGKLFAGVRTYPMAELEKVVREENISIGIIVVPGEKAEEVAERLVTAGVTGILNYTPRPLNVPSHVYLEEYDMITSIEKVAYHSKV
ncbi:MAG: redox-sensing transcriptional repressor Rex, partial [Bacteroidales bacterium]